MKKKTVSKLKKDLWKVFSRYVRLRDAVRTTGNCKSSLCITCERLEDITKMDAGHFFSRTHSATLFHEKNVHAQCKRCNMLNGGEQFLYAQKVDKLYGEGTAEELNQLRHTTKRFSRPELEDMIEEYKEKLNELIDDYGTPWQG